MKIGSRAGANEGEAAHDVRMIEGQFLRNHAAHRRADNVRRSEIQASNQLGGIVRELAGAIRGERTVAGLSNVAIVKQQTAKTGVDEAGDLRPFPTGTVRTDT